MGKGQLVFKGEKVKKKKSKTKHSVNDNGAKDVEQTPIASTTLPAEEERAVTASAAKSTGKSEPQTTSSTVAPVMKQGTGKITTSGTVVTGHDTKFEKELNIGDAILCVLENGTEELRVITMRLSNVSLNLSSAFSKNIKIPSTFHFIRKPRDIQKERTDAQKRQMDTLQEQRTHVFDLYSNESLVYREKTETGSYRIRREHVGSGESKTRGSLLELRAKKSSDKYC